MTQRIASSWSAADVAKWLDGAGFAELSSVFLAEAASGDVLLTLTSAELRDDLGVSQFGAPSLGPWSSL